MIPGSNLLRNHGQSLGRFALGTVIACLCTSTASAQMLVFKAELTGASAVPPATTSGMGTAYFIVDLDADTVTYNLTYDQLSSAETAAHIEGFALPGSTGTTQVTLGPGKHKTGVWNYGTFDEQSLLDGLAYVVIESSAFPTGELRGQIERIVAHRSFVADLSGAQEVPPVTTAATGTGVFWADTQTNVLNYLITYADLSSAETESHLHGYATAGTTAPVVFDLGLGFHKSGTWTFAQVNENDILADLVYANIHTANNPTGEVRGQVLMTAANPDTYCTAKVNSQLCSPEIAFTGTSTLGGLDNFKISAPNVINQTIAALMWSPVSDNSPFLNGTQCVAAATMAPLVVTATAGNMGPADCSGVPSFDFTHAKMNSLGLVAGDLVFMQWWYRDNGDSTGFGASDAIVVTILP